MIPTSAAGEPQAGRTLGIPAWMWLSILTIAFWGAWGLQSKVIVDRISPWTNQVLFPIGLLPLIFWAARSPRLAVGTNKKKGALHGLVTGFLGATGNVAFYLSLERGGKVSVVVPLTALFPLVTVILAFIVLKEKMAWIQTAGLVLALVSIYLLSV